MMTCPSNVWEAQEKLRLAVWPGLVLQAMESPIHDDGRGAIKMDKEVQSNDSKFKVVHWSRMAMFDWDFAKEGEEKHPWRYLQEGEKPELKRRLRLLESQGVGIRLYKTPGGLRAFVTSREMELKEWFHLAAWLHTDVWYMQVMMARSKGLQPGWACRVSPKPGRQGDYVAQLLVQLGEVSSELEPYIKLHDALVERFHYAQ